LVIEQRIGTSSNAGKKPISFQTTPRYAKGTKAKHEGKDPQSKVLEHRIKHSKQTSVQSGNIDWKKCNSKSKQESFHAY